MSTWIVVGDHVEPAPGPVVAGVHPTEQCAGRPCVVHRPSNHHLRGLRLHWRNDRAMFERLCTHGIGHPDPDQITYWRATLPAEDAAAQAVHGCCGCCQPTGKAICVFCRIAGGEADADFVIGWDLPATPVMAFRPLNPVVPGHVLFAPRHHVRAADDDPDATAAVFEAAALYARDRVEPFNLITSAGAEATQTVFHLHAHYIPRSHGDGLHLPWTTQHQEQA